MNSPAAASLITALRYAAAVLVAAEAAADVAASTGAECPVTGPALAAYAAAERAHADAAWAAGVCHAVGCEHPTSGAECYAHSA